jgi:anaerobic magnesium-protoporphyrin IX monomethyl ester cyclase
MRVLLIAPRFSGYQEQVAFLEPTGLCLLAAVLEKAGHQTRILHQLTPEQLPDERIVRIATEFEPDCIGLTSFTENSRIAVELAARLRTVSSAPIIYGGVHATYYPEIASLPQIDAVVMGQGVETFPRILARLAEGRAGWDGIPGVAFEREGRVVQGDIQGIGGDLDSLPIPKRDDLPIDAYKVYPVLFMAPSRQRMMSVYSAWGCKYNCSFCTIPKLYQRRWDAQSPDRVMEELRVLKHKFKANLIHFHDDDFLMDRRRVTEICEKMIAENLDLKFSMMTRFDHLDREILDLMERAGLIMGTFGIEAGTEEGLRELRKSLRREQIREALTLLADRNVQVNCTYMIGFPWETMESILEAFEFIKGLQMDTWSLNVLIPFRGAPIRETLDREGLIVDDDLSKYSYKQVVVRTRTLSRERLRDLVRALLRRYYFRKEYVIHVLKRMARHPVMIRPLVEIFLWGIIRRHRLIFEVRSRRIRER